MNPQDTFVSSGKALVSEGTQASFAGILLAIASMALVVVLLRMIRRGVLRRLSPKMGYRKGHLHAGSLILNYFLGLIAFGLVVRIFHVNLNTLTLVFGALSVGIGFGLQNIVNNFVCGLVILFERPVKIDDRIIIDGMEGSIVDIGIRATTVLTNEGVSVIVPNSQFITSAVVNRSLDNPMTRFKVPVGVAYGTDPRLVEKVLMEVAAAHPGALRMPPPVVVFEAFGDSSLQFYLWVWTKTFTDRPVLFRSELNYAIHDALKAAGIQVPFPQMDVHLNTAGGPNPKPAGVC
jgi:small-conductance mechanosensitive channel